MPVTIATAQFVSTSNTDANVAAMLDLVAEAAAHGARLVHFAEFTNHPTWYANADHAWQSAITIPGPMFDALAGAARRHGVYVSFNASVRARYPQVFDQNHLLGPDGSLLAANRKQILMSFEKDVYEPGHEEAVVADTEIGRIGLMSCMDGLIPETARVLALRGAELICNALSSNGLDEAHTHIPARAAENGVFVISSNRVGALVDPEALPALVELSGIPEAKLAGAGESEIVAPDGSVIAKLSRDALPAIAYATVDLDATERAARLARRRPETYGMLVTPNGEAPFSGELPPAGPVRLAAAGVDASLGADAAVAAAVEAVIATDADLVVLPELAVLQRDALADPHGVLELAERLLESLGAACRDTGRYAVVGVPARAPGVVAPAGTAGERGGGPAGPARPARLRNAAILLGPAGIVARYDQVHVHPDDDSWAEAGDSFVTADLPAGRVGLLVGYDLDFPEAARVLAREGADVIACPMTWRASFEHELLAPERAAENHCCLVVAARPDGPAGGGHVICSLPGEYRFPETGEVNMPDREDAKPGEVLVVASDLSRSRDKLLMGRTDLLRDSQPALYGALVAPAGALAT